MKNPKGFHIGIAYDNFPPKIYNNRTELKFALIDNVTSHASLLPLMKMVNFNFGSVGHNLLNTLRISNIRQAIRYNQTDRQMLCQ